jgi:hypothetical protein
MKRGHWCRLAKNGKGKAANVILPAIILLTLSKKTFPFIHKKVV